VKQARGGSKKSTTKKPGAALAKRGGELDVEKARTLLARSHDVDEIRKIKDGAQLAAHYARMRGAGVESINDALEIVLRAQRRLGEFLIEAGPKRSGPGRGKKGPRGDFFSFASLKLDKKEAGRAKKIAKAPEEVFESHIAAVRSKGARLTMSGMIAAASSSKKYDGDEHYTPSDYIDLVREVLGSIDLDPASNIEAQTTVGAALWYGKKEDGLAHEWSGRVFLNPPYSDPAPWIAKLLEALGSGAVPEAIVLTNNTTDTDWAQSLLDASAAVCFTRGRIAFDRPGSKANKGTRQGQVFFYLGNDPDSFIAAFEEFSFDADKEPVRNAILRPAAPLYVPEIASTAAEEHEALEAQREWFEEEQPEASA
jgi:phage N-6-adenine-methyltransferase